MADDRTATTSETSQSFFAMSFSDKLKFLGKVVVFLATGGFMFPNIFSD